MNFKNGYLGACIIVLGVVMTIVGGYLLSIEVTDEEVTKYSYVADLNGLFDSEPAPAYIEYNPSTNYTGYYTDGSIVNGNKYFAGVDYDTSGQPNAYRLNVMPENYESGTETTITSTGAYSDYDVYLRGVYLNSQNQPIYPQYRSDDNTTIDLTTLIASLNLDPLQNLVQIKSIDNSDAITWPQSDSSAIHPDWILFTVKSNWESGLGGYNHYITLYTDAYNESHGTNGPLPMLSCEIDVERNQVKLFYDNDCKNQAGIYLVSDILVTWGGDNDGSIDLTFGDSFDYVYQTKPDVVYMDIRGGVSVEESL